MGQVTHKKLNSAFYTAVRSLLEQSREELVRSVNVTIASTYFQVGKLIVEHQQSGSAKAAYGKNLVNELSHRLTAEFGKGFSVDNLENMRRFYLCYRISETVSRKSFQAGQGFQRADGEKKNGKKKNGPSISETVSRKLMKQEKPQAPVFSLSWSHYVFLIRIEDEAERKFYEIEAINEQWSLRELKRQYDASLFERLVLSRNKKQVKELSKKGHVISKASDAVKDPYILEFLGLPELAAYNESDLESAIINKIEDFLNELGKGFLFVGRQYRISIDEDHHYVDLVFYHPILRSFVLIDLKMGDLTARDLGQMQLYVGYFDEQMKDPTENKTIGIILCKNKKESIVRFTLPKDNKQIFTSKYKTYLPDKKDLRSLMEDEAVYEVRSISLKKERP